MTSDPDSPQFRAHLGELRRAVGGLGRDFSGTFSDLDTKIAKWEKASRKEAKYLAWEIEDDFNRIGREIGEEARKFPGSVRDGAAYIGEAVAEKTVAFAGATRDAIQAAGHKTAQGTKNALAAAAGVRRTPMKEWRSPSSSDRSDES
jgi:hypothetical protein